MRSAGLRNKPIDRRRLSMRDRSDYNNSGEYGSAARALSRARQYRGRQAYRNNTPPNTQGRSPGTGGFTGGLAIQQMRNRQAGIRRNPERFENIKSFRTPSNKGDLYEPNDPR